MRNLSGPRRSVLLVVLIAGLSAAGAGTAGGQSGLEIMQKQDRLQRAGDEEVVFRMQIVSQAGETKERRMASYTLGGPQDLSKTLIRFLAPRDIENTGLLTWEGKDGNDDQWLYLPATRKVKRIVAGAKKNRFMGTDFTYEDLRPENLALHTYTLIGSETLDGQDCSVVEAVPATDRQAADSGYSRRRQWIRKDNYFTIKQEFYDRKGKLEKVGAARKVASIKGTLWRAGELEMRDVQAGTRTVLLAERRALDTGLKDSFFTEAELTRGNL